MIVQRVCMSFGPLSTDRMCILDAVLWYSLEMSSVCYWYLTVYPFYSVCFVLSSLTFEVSHLLRLYGSSNFLHYCSPLFEGEIFGLCSPDSLLWEHANNYNRSMSGDFFISGHLQMLVSKRGSCRKFSSSRPCQPPYIHGGS